MLVACGLSESSNTPDLSLGSCRHLLVEQRIRAPQPAAPSLLQRPPPLRWTATSSTCMCHRRKQQCLRSLVRLQPATPQQQRLRMHLRPLSCRSFQRLLQDLLTWQRQLFTAHRSSYQSRQQGRLESGRLTPVCMRLESRSVTCGIVWILFNVLRMSDTAVHVLHPALDFDLWCAHRHSAPSHPQRRPSSCIIVCPSAACCAAAAFRGA